MIAVQQLIASFCQMKNICKLCEKSIRKPSGNYPKIICLRCSHAEQARLKYQNKRSRDRIPKETIGFHQWVFVLAKHNFACVKCGKTGRKNITLDHIKPLGKKGRNLINNAQPLCHKCHQKKDQQKPKIFKHLLRKIRQVHFILKYNDIKHLFYTPQASTWFMIIFGLFMQSC